MMSQNDRISQVLKRIKEEKHLSSFSAINYSFEKFSKLTAAELNKILPQRKDRTTFWNKFKKYRAVHAEEFKLGQEEESKEEDSSKEGTNEKDCEESETSDSESDDSAKNVSFDVNYARNSAERDSDREDLIIEEATSPEFSYDSETLRSSALQKTAETITQHLEKTTPAPSTSKVGNLGSSTSKDSPSAGGSDNIIKKYLQKTPGILVTNFYKKNGRLTSKYRNLLAQTIIEKEHDTFLISGYERFSIAHERLLLLARQITEVFPKENAECYFTPYNPNSKAQATGKLFQAYNNLKKKLRHSLKCLDDEHRNLIVEPDEETKEKLRFLQKKTSPWERVKSLWKDTFSARNNILSENTYTILNYYTEFPPLKCPNGFELLVQDFDQKFPEEKQTFMTEWPNMNQKLIQLAEKKFKQEIIENVYLTTPHQTRGFVILPRLLHYAYLPKREGRKRVKLSVQEIYNKLVLRVDTPNLLMETLEKDRAALVREGLQGQPRLIWAGRDNESLAAAYIKVNETLYFQDTAVQSIENYMKVIFALNAKYSAGTGPIWTFLQKYVFHIHTDYDVEYNSVNDIFNQIQNLT